jgi:hypothetical protein
MVVLVLVTDGWVGDQSAMPYHGSQRHQFAQKGAV